MSETPKDCEIFVCCRCVPDDRLDSDALFLLRQQCPQHGLRWHRKMLRDASGKMRLAVPLRKPANNAG